MALFVKSKNVRATRLRDGYLYLLPALTVCSRTKKVYKIEPLVALQSFPDRSNAKPICSSLALVGAIAIPPSTSVIIGDL